jgi:acetylornithine deacetylase
MWGCCSRSMKSWQSRRAGGEQSSARARVPFLINGEPTDSRLATGTKGSVRVIITTEGRAAHSAYPEAGESAIEKLLDILQDIRACEWPEDSFFGTTTCNIGVLNGGTRPNVIQIKRVRNCKFGSGSI